MGWEGREGEGGTHSIILPKEKRVLRSTRSDLPSTCYPYHGRN